MNNIQRYLKPMAVMMTIMMSLVACSFQHNVNTGNLMKGCENIPEGSKPMGLAHAEVWKWNAWYNEPPDMSQKVFKKLQEEAIKRGADAVTDVSFRSETMAGIYWSSFLFPSCLAGMKFMPAEHWLNSRKRAISKP